MAINKSRIEPTLGTSASEEMDAAVFDRVPAHLAQRERPFAISVIGALMLASGIAALGLLWFFLVDLYGQHPWSYPVQTVLQVNLLIGAFVALVGSFFVWSGHRVGWTAMVFLLIFGTLLGVQGLAYGFVSGVGAPDQTGLGLSLLERSGIRVLLNAAALAYLFSASVRKFFLLNWREALVCSVIAIIPVIALWLWSASVIHSAS